ncbi:hypothetical protein DPMN_168566 [Dreissena polymorpha]|uniref:Uncharacterized protein n=1 Tax=Dreissena polymorpha TaxID=45954 RepID=A0A9D4F6R1_DREPO|nr:hypothetical protein DPMN_168566 [Dreissena polymorpha]
MSLVQSSAGLFHIHVLATATRDEARAAAIEALNRRADPEIPTEDVIVKMDTVLENNTFSFNDEHFIQTEGTAIGSRL